MKHYTVYFAQAYGSGTYGDGTYSCTTQQQASGTCEAVSTGNATGGGLADTGIAVIAIVTLACLLVFATLVVRFWRRKTVQPVAVDEEDQKTGTSDS